MQFDMQKASRMLSELDLKIITDRLLIDVLWFRAMPIEESWFISRHMHSSFEFHLIHSGKCTVKTGDGEFIAREGEFYLTAPGVLHEQSGDGSESFVEYSLNCDLSLLDEEDAEARHIIKVLRDAPCKPVKDLYGIIALFDGALMEAYNRKLGYYKNIKSLAMQIVLLSARALSDGTNEDFDMPVIKKKGDYRLKQIEKYIKDNIERPISTLDIANHMYLSEKQVCRIIRSIKGCSTKELIDGIKILKAKELLKNPKLSIGEISEILGFKSEYYFNRFFRRLELYPPGYFRDNFLSLK